MTSTQMLRDRFAVVGNPIGHSLSPTIHSAFAQQTNQAIDYQAVLVAVDDFEHWVQQFFDEGGHGLNVTLPFKTRAFTLADQATSRAQAAGAANFLMRDEAGSIIADNTDGRGLVTDVTVNAGWPLRDTRILLLGAGGAVRGVIPALLAEAPHCVFVANRTPDRAQQLAQAWTSDAIPVSGGGYHEVPTEAWDVIINGTSTGLSNEMPALPDSMAFSPRCCAYDMAYGRAPTPFMAWASARGVAEVLDGLGMLVEQAAESFFLWRGEYPETTSVVSSLRVASGVEP